jgi:hypothetical protein
MAETNHSRIATESGGSFPKTAPLRGSLHVEWRRCGKPRCRCTRGTLHGPYWVRRWWENGKQRKAYVRRHQVADVAAGIAAWQTLHPPVWAMRQALADLRRLEQEIVS